MAVPIDVLLVIGGSAVGALNAISATSSRIEALGRSTSIFGRELAQLGRSITFMVTGPIVALAGAALKASADFDQAMRRVAGISPEFVALPQNFARAKKELGDLATEFGVDVLKLADAFRLVNEAGIQGEQSFEVMRVIAKTAAAAFVEPNAAAQGIVAVINSYRESNVTAQQAADFLFRTLDKGVGDFDGLNAAISNVLPTAAALRISLPELSGAISLLTRYGFDWSEATVSLNRFLLDFVKNNKQADEMAKTLGIDLSEQAIITKGLSGVIDDIATKVGIWNIATESAGDKAKEQAKAISSQSAAIRDQYQAQIIALERQKEAIGTTSDQTRALNSNAQAIRDNTRAQLDAINTQITQLTAEKNNVSLSTKQKAAIQEQIDALRIRSRELQNDTNAQIGNINAQKRGLDATNDARSAIQKQINTLRLNARESVLALQSQRRALLELAGTEDNYEKVLAKVSERTGLTIDQLRRLFPDVRAFRAALVLTSGEGENFANIMEEVGDTTGALDQVFKESSKAFLFTWNQFVETLKVAGIEMGERWLPRLRDFIDFAKDLVMRFRELNPATQDWIVKVLTLTAALGPVLLIVGTLIRSMGDALLSIGRVTSLIRSINPIFAIFRLGITGLVPIIAGVGIALVLLKTAWDNNWGGIRDTLQVVIAKIHELLANLVPPELRQKFDEIWTNIFGGLQADVDQALNPVRGSIDAFIVEIKDNFKPIMEIWDGIKDNWVKTLDSAQTLINTIWEKMTKKLDEIRTKWQNTFTPDAITFINTVLNLTNDILIKMNALIANTDFTQLWQDTLNIMRQLAPLFVVVAALLANQLVIVPLITAFTAFLAALTPIIAPLGTVLTFFLGVTAIGPAVSTIFGALATYLRTIGPILSGGGFMNALRLLPMAIGGFFQIAIAGAASWLPLIGLLVAALAAIALGIMFIKEKWDLFGPLFQRMWEILAETFTTLLLPVLQDLWRAMQELWVVIQPFVEFLLKIVAGLAGFVIVGVIVTLVILLTAAIIALTAVFKVLAVVFDAITALIKMLIKYFQDLGGQLNASKAEWDKIFGGLNDWLNEVKIAFDNASRDIQKVWNDLWNAVGNFITDLAPTVILAAAKLLGQIFDAVNGIFEEIKKKVGEALQWIADRLPHSPAKEGPLSQPIDWSFIYEGLDIPGSVISNLQGKLQQVSDAVNGVKQDVNNFTELRLLAEEEAAKLKNVLTVGGGVGAATQVVPNALGKYAIIPYGATPGPNAPILGYTNSLEALVSAITALNTNFNTGNFANKNADVKIDNLNVSIDGKEISQAVVAYAHAEIGDTFKLAKERVQKE